MTYKTFYDLQWKPHRLAIEAQGKDFLSKNKDAKHEVKVQGENAFDFDGVACVLYKQGIED